MPRILSRLAALASLVVALAGCGRHLAGLPVANLRPEVRLSGGPAPSSDVTYNVALYWTATDSDGEIAYFRYAIDPPHDADTTWTTVTVRQLALSFPATEPPDPLPSPGQRVTARDQHVFVLVAVDNEGLRSEPAIRSFTARTIVPTSTIRSPRPTVVAIGTLPSLTISWDGLDVDGPTGVPLGYRYRLVEAGEVWPDDPDYAPASRVQEFFGREAVLGFAGWDSTGSETTSVSLEGLQVDRTYLFAVSAFDEAGAAESRFLPSSNVLQFRPTFNRQGPRMTVFNAWFRRSLSGGVSQAPSRILPFEIPGGSAITLSWFGEPATGAQMAGYRWALDIADLSDETPRADENDLAHWSAWSLDETSATIGPFAGGVGEPEVHYLRVLGRDNLGFTTLFTVELRAVAYSGERPLLVIDDRYGPLAAPTGAFPTEVEEDTFHFAVGGVPDRLVGGTSVPGAFAGFAYDTLDYRTRYNTPGQGAGIPLSVLSHYRAVAWFTDNTSASAGVGNSTNPPATAFRFVNTASNLNSLVAYLRQGGQAFLFGEGAVVAIAGGYWGSNRTPPTIPYTATNVLRPGSFLYDFLRMRSSLTTTSLLPERLQGAIPYLPEFRGPATPTDRSHDPRIGPGAERTAARWSGLPRLTMANWRGGPADPAQRSVPWCWNVAAPLHQPDLDTLYLFQAQTLNTTAGASDGRPTGLHVYTPGQGQIVWLGFPLYYFEPAQARALVRTVLGVFGLEPQASRRAGPRAVPAAYEDGGS